MRFEDLLIAQPPMTRYVAAPPADAPHIVEALGWARNGSRPPLEDSTAGKSWKEIREQAIAYGIATRPDRLQAPPLLPVELALLAAETALVPIEDLPLRTVLKLAPLMAASVIVLAKLRERAERASARRQGVCPETAPRLRSQAGSWLLLFPVSFLWRGALGQGRQHWTTRAVTAALRRLRLRRSWQRAYAAARK